MQWNLCCILQKQAGFCICKKKHVHHTKKKTAGATDDGGCPKPYLPFSPPLLKKINCLEPLRTHTGVRISMQQLPSPERPARRSAQRFSPRGDWRPALSSSIVHASAGGETSPEHPRACSPTVAPPPPSARCPAGSGKQQYQAQVHTLACGETHKPTMKLQGLRLACPRSKLLRRLPNSVSV